MKKNLRFAAKTCLILAAFLCFGNTLVLAVCNLCQAPDVSAHHYKRGSTGDYAKPPNLDDDSLLNFTSNSVNDTAIDISIKGAFQFGGNAVTQVAQTVKDAAGNSYVTGGFTGSITLGTTTLTSSNGYDMYVAKLDANQQYVWARMAAGSSTVAEHFSLDGGTSLAVDREGHVYVGGTFVKSLAFLDADGQSLHQLTDGRNDDNLNMELFVVKYSPEGELLWALGGDSQSTGAPNSLAVDRNFVNSVMLDGEDYPYIAGAYSGNSFWGEATDLVGKSDFLLASLDKDGLEPFWISTTGTPEDDYAASISVDTLGYLNVLGVIGSGVMELPYGEGTWDNDTGTDDTFVISYDIDGEWYFAKFIGGGDQAIGNDVATSENGDFFVTGMFTKDVLFPGSESQYDIELYAEGAPEGFIAKYDLQGDLLWAKQFGGGGAMYAHKVTTDTEGNVFVLGRYEDFVVFDEASASPTMLMTNSANDGFIAKYANDGRFLWAKQIESTGSQSIDRVARGDTQPMITQPLDLAYTPANGGELLLSGDFDGTLMLDQVALNAPANARSSFVATYKLEARAVSLEPTLEVVSEFVLAQNYPNPFNPVTTIGFSLPNTDDVTIDVYNNMGHKVRTLVNTRLAKGHHQTQFDGSNLASGVYFYTIRAGQFAQTKKMTLVK